VRLRSPFPLSSIRSRDMTRPRCLTPRTQPRRKQHTVLRMKHILSQQSFSTCLDSANSQLASTSSSKAFFEVNTKMSFKLQYDRRCTVHRYPPFRRINMISLACCTVHRSPPVRRIHITSFARSCTRHASRCSCADSSDSTAISLDLLALGSALGTIIRRSPW
jgi:hypothetical protein